MSRQVSPTPSLASSECSSSSSLTATGSPSTHLAAVCEPLTPLSAQFEVPALVISLPDLRIEVQEEDKGRRPSRAWEGVSVEKQDKGAQVTSMEKCATAKTCPIQTGKSKSLLLRPVSGLGSATKRASLSTGPTRPSIAISRRSQSCPPRAQTGAGFGSVSSSATLAQSAPMKRHAGPYALFSHRRAASPNLAASTLAAEGQAHGPPPPYSVHPQRKYLLVGPAIAQHLREGGGVRVRDYEGSVLGWLNSVDARE